MLQIQEMEGGQCPLGICRDLSPCPPPFCETVPVYLVSEVAPVSWITLICIFPRDELSRSSLRTFCDSNSLAICERLGIEFECKRLLADYTSVSRTAYRMSSGYAESSDVSFRSGEE